MRLFFVALVLAVAAALAAPWAGGCAQPLRVESPARPAPPAREAGAPHPARTAAGGGGAAPAGEPPAGSGAAAPAGDLPPGGQVVQAVPIPARAWVREAPGPVVMLVLEDDRIRPAAVHAELYGRVRLLVVNHGRQPHNLVIPDFRLVAMTLAPGEENYIEFTADRKGDFPMYSDAPRPGEPEPGLMAVLKVR